MRAYRWCGLTIVTDIEFPELAETTADAAAPVLSKLASPRQWQLRRREGRAPRRAGRRWFHRWRFPDGRRWVAFARDRVGHVLRFPGLVDFDVRSADQVIDCYPQPGTPENTLRHLALDQVLPLIVGTPDSIALHGSVIGTPAGAVAFLGQSGLGKSTLAATLGQRGYSVLSDDCCLLVRSGRGFDVVPSYPGVRLNPDSLEQMFGDGDHGPHVSHYSQKRRVGDRERFGFSDQPVRLSRLYVIAARDQLQETPAISITGTSKRDALYALIDYTFHLDIGYAPRIRETFELAGAIVDAYEVRRLAYPWDLAASDALAEAVVGDIADDQATLSVSKAGASARATMLGSHTVNTVPSVGDDDA